MPLHRHRRLARARMHPRRAVHPRGGGGADLPPRRHRQPARPRARQGAPLAPLPLAVRAARTATPLATP
eukprot:scaffold21577_cov67-Phaeocystis_antarctica.AAC.1